MARGAGAVVAYRCRTWRHGDSSDWCPWCCACSRPGSTSPLTGFATPSRATRSRRTPPIPDEAFKRSFERDKAELRELGIPLETGRNSVFDTEDGYRIARQDFELPPIEFTADEAAAVGLAGRLWQHRVAGHRGPHRADQAAGRRHRDRGAARRGRAAPAARQRAGAAGADGGGVRAPGGAVRLPQAVGAGAGEADRRAVGRAVLAGPVVPGRPRPGPRRRAQLPAGPAGRRGQDAGGHRRDQPAGRPGHAGTGPRRQPPARPAGPGAGRAGPGRAAAAAGPAGARAPPRGTC